MIRMGVLVGVAVLGSYTLLAAYAYFFSDRQLFFPNYGSLNKALGYLEISDGKGGQLAALYLPNPEAKYALWYFHGNAETLGDLEPRMLDFQRNGYAVFAVEYPGYGLNRGTPTEAGIYQTTEIGLKYLEKTLGMSSESIIAYGRSLGGGPAVALAADQQIGGLILESAFTSAFRVVTRVRILPFDKFDNLGKISAVSCPVLVIHGMNDRIVSFSHGEVLYDAIPDRKQKLWIKHAGHNDLLDWAGPTYWKALSEFTEALD